MHAGSPTSRPSRGAHPGPQLTGAPTVWAVLAILAVLAFGAYLRFVDTGPLPIDTWWHSVVGVSRGSTAYAVAVALADVGGAIGAATCGAIAAALLLVLRRPREAAAVTFALIIGVLSSELIKALVLRPRPPDPMVATAGQSYPSGHSMGAGALFVSLALVFVATESASTTVVRTASIAATGLVVFMMWSRTALHVHWITDTFAGALLGAAIAILSRRLWVRSVGPPT